MRESQFSQSMRNTLQDNMARVGTERYELVLQCWTSDEFRPFTIYRWADNELRSYYQSRTTSPAYIPNLVCAAVADAIEYLGLLFNWHKFTRAIERSKFVGNAWLYF
jgi:hypothetical protein